MRLPRPAFPRSQVTLSLACLLVRQSCNFMHNKHKCCNFVACFWLALACYFFAINTHTKCISSFPQVGSSIAILGTYLYSLAMDKWAAETKAKKAASEGSK